MNPSEIDVVAFDGDDTLWLSETFFVLTQQRFDALLSPWCDASQTADRLLQRERQNLSHFGYGVKGFALSMIETAIEASEGDIPSAALGEIVQWAREMMEHPVELLPGVVETLDALDDHYRLVIVTKGDLFHQESKVAASGLAERFEAIHIVSEKDPVTYQRIVDGLGITPDRFMMVGNSTRSDIEPVLGIGGHAVHVPHDHTWALEHADQYLDIPVLVNLTELVSLLEIDSPAPAGAPEV
jgi:putative hydrolase of the HAD superfamily